MVDAAERTFLDLLDRELDFDATTSDDLTNHLPMALLAKWRLGADAEELLRFRAKYQRKLVPLPSPKLELDGSNWTSAIGQKGVGGDLRRYFARAIAERGVDDVLFTHLPELLPGIGGAAFHGVIRLSYALDAYSPARIAAGLAYLAEVGSPLGEIPDRAPESTTVSDAAAILSDADCPLPRPEGINIGARMRFVASDEMFKDAVSSLKVTDDTDSQLTEFALHLFATSGDFTSLHAVTGMSAISSIRPWVKDQEALDRYAFQSLLAAYGTLGAPTVWTRSKLDEFSDSNGSTISEILSVGALSDDEHVSKLIYTTLARWTELGDPLYLAVAARYAGMSD